MLKEICEELGIPIEEEWIGNDGMRYRINKYGKVFQYDTNGLHTMNNYDRWKDIFTGELKPIWKPKNREKYYTPFITIYEADRFIFRNWEDDDTDNWYLENNLAFKTETEAIECTNRMLKAIKEGR